MQSLTSPAAHCSPESLPGPSAPLCAIKTAKPCRAPGLRYFFATSCFSYLDDNSEPWDFTSKLFAAKVRSCKFYCSQHCFHKGRPICDVRAYVNTGTNLLKTACQAGGPDATPCALPNDTYLRRCSEGAVVELSMRRAALSPQGSCRVGCDEGLDMFVQAAKGRSDQRKALPAEETAIQEQMHSE